MRQHQYVERETGKVVDEKMFADPIIQWLYSGVREKAPTMFNALTSSRFSSLLGYLNYESSLGFRLSGNQNFLKRCGFNFSECVDHPDFLDTPKKVFERKIQYWNCRPLPSDANAIVSPADSRVLVGSMEETSQLFLKEKFFCLDELLKRDVVDWSEEFADGEFAVFRLTPEKYHYNHSPVSGEVVDFYEVLGTYHSCNPSALVTIATPYSKNKRNVTIIDTDVEGGSNIGLVAMVEVVALMIGDILQCYSSHKYEDPKDMERSLFMEKGQPKSLFRPGSSTVVTLFQKDRVQFAPEIVSNMTHPFAESRFSFDLQTPLVETDVKVRSPIATPKN